MDTEKNNNDIPQINIDNLKTSFNFINSLLNRCNTKGLFTLDEAYMAKVYLNSIYLGIDTLDKYQNVCHDVINNENDK
jgi:hypothetical protein